MKYKFEDIAFNSTEKKKPVESDKSHYIGLEHLDSQCLTVNRYGSDVAPIGEKLIMKKGDVLFGKRRAYQKKVAIAPFDGIFSAHGFVLRPKENVIDKNFFPFFISSDYFLDKAISISVGSLSPTINWSDLKVIEFELPDLEEQKRLANILWKIEELKASIDNLYFYSLNLYQESINDINSKFNKKCIKDIILKIKLEKASIGTIPYLEIGDININNKTYQLKDKPSVSGAVKVDYDDILISLVRPTRGAIVRVKENNLSASAAFCVLRCENKLFQNFLFNYLLFNQKFFNSFESKQTGTTYPTCKDQDIYEYTIPLPETEQEILSVNNSLSNVIQIIKILIQKKTNLQELERKIIKEALNV